MDNSIEKLRVRMDNHAEDLKTFKSTSEERHGQLLGFIKGVDSRTKRIEDTMLNHLTTPQGSASAAMLQTRNGETKKLVESLMRTKSFLWGILSALAFVGIISGWLVANWDKVHKFVTTIGG